MAEIKETISSEALVQAFIKDFPFPEICHKVFAYASHPHYSGADIAALIEEDKALSQHLLRLINSVLYKHQVAITSISRAITVLGVDEIKHLLLGLSLFKLTISHATVLPLFWQKTMYCSVLAKVFSKQNTVFHGENVFLMGFLANIGQLVIAHTLPDMVLKIMAKAQGHILVEPILEEEILGFTRADIGGELIKQWGLPDSIYEGVAYQFSPDTSEHHFFDAQLVYLSSVLSANLEHNAMSLQAFWQEVSEERKTLLKPVESKYLLAMVLQAQDESLNVFELFKNDIYKAEFDIIPS